MIPDDFSTSASLQWQAPEYGFVPKTAGWFWAIGIIAVSLIAIALFTENFLFAIIILLAVFTLVIYAVQRPATVTYALNQRGLLIENRLYPFSGMKSFWVSPDDRRPQLIIDIEKPLNPTLVIALRGIDPEVVRQHLLPHVPEEEHTDSVAELIIEYLGF